MLRVAFAGTPAFAVPTLRALAASPHALVGVLTQPDRPAGRGRELKGSPVKRLAQELNLPLSQPVTLQTPEARAALASWAADAPAAARPASRSASRAICSVKNRKPTTIATLNSTWK